MNLFSKTSLLSFTVLTLCLSVSLAHSYTNIAVNADGSPIKFPVSSAGQLVLTWNPEAGPMQDTDSIHTFDLERDYQEYVNYCGGSSGGNGSGGCSLNPFLSDVMAASAVTNAEGVALINSAFAVWDSQATDANVSYIQGASLGVDVDVCNYTDFIDSAYRDFAINGDANDPRVCGCLGTCNTPCTNPVVFDANGDIIALEAGEGNRYSVLGSAGPIIWPGINYILKFEAIINGVCLDDSPATGCGGVSVNNDELLSVMVHELGHAQGLGHSQVNPKSIGYSPALADPYVIVNAGAYLISDATWGLDGAVPTMYPFLVTGATQSSLMMDDKIGLAHLYPASTFTSNYCTLQGNVYTGVSGLRCVEVVFRDSSSQVLNAVSVISGGEAANNGEGGVANPTWTNQVNPGTNACADTNDNCGKYTVNVPAGKTYNIEVNAIPTLEAGSGIGPCISNPEFAGVNQVGGNSWTLPQPATQVVCGAGGTTITPAGDPHLSITTVLSPL